MLHATGGPIDTAQLVDRKGSFEGPVPFQFRVSWISVFDPFEGASPVRPVVPAGEPMPGVVPALLKPTALSVPPLAAQTLDEPLPAAAAKVSPSTSFQWEMVVPKMVRTAGKKMVRELPPRNPVKSGFEEAPASEPSAPNFYTASSGSISWGQQRSLLMKLAMAAAGVGAIITPVWRHFGSARGAGTEIQTSMQAGGWSREPVTRIDAGFNRARQLVVYRPSLKATDCRFEFDWKPATSGVGWVFRAQDTANYYAMKIRLLKDGATPSLGVEHFAVYRGVESAHIEKVLVLPRSQPVLRIQTDIAGPTFTLYLGSAAADYWTDARLVSGGLGFFEEWHQGAEVQTVRMSFAPGTEIHPDSLRLYMNAPVQ